MIPTTSACSVVTTSKPGLDRLQDEDPATDGGQARLRPRFFCVELCGVGAPYRRRAGKGGAFRDRSSPASGPGHPSQMGGVRRRAKQYFATRLPHPWSLSFGHPWPNRSLQAPPLPRSLGSGTATGQKRRPDLSTKPWRRISQGAPVSGGLSGEKSLWDPAGQPLPGGCKPPFRGLGPLPPGRPTRPRRRP